MMKMTRMRTIKVLATATTIWIGGLVTAGAQSPAMQPAAPQPSLPAADATSTNKPGSPTVDQIVRQERPPLVVRKQAQVHRHVTHRRIARMHAPRYLDRPALAGVELLAPLPPPGEPPHFVVPLPAYPLDTVASTLTTPLPQIVCRPAPRDFDAPDAHLYREVPVACEPDNP